MELYHIKMKTAKVIPTYKSSDKTLLKIQTSEFTPCFFQINWKTVLQKIKQ